MRDQRITAVAAYGFTVGLKLGTALALVTMVGAAAAQTSPAPAPTAAPVDPNARPGTVITPMPPGIVPQRGQTGDQAQLDVAQCQNAASQATGYVPGTTTAPPPVDKSPKGGRAKGAAKGAAGGAIVGAVNDPYPNLPNNNNVGSAAGAGAAAGAVAGGMNQRQDRRKSTAEQKKAAEAQGQKATAWQNNYAGCLQQRGYTLQ